MIHCFRYPLLLALAAVSPALAQTILPSKAATSEPGKVWDDARPVGLGYFNQIRRHQMLYDADDIPTAAASWQRLLLRVPHTYGSSAGTWTVRIELSSGPRRPEQASVTFTSNHGPDRRVVFDGQIALPARSSGPWPQPWEPAIPFLQPFEFTKASGVQSLVIDMTMRSSAIFSIWLAEAYGRENGWATTALAQPDCVGHFGIVSGAASTFRSEIWPGGKLDFALNFGHTQGSTAVNALVLSAGGPGTKVFGLTTPFLLTDLGIPAPPSCYWAIGYDGWTTVLAYRPSGTTCEIFTSPPIPIPSAPELAGLVFYTQALALDRNIFWPDRFFPTVATRWQIGPGTAVPAALVMGSSAPQDPPPATGSVNGSHCVSVRLET